MRTLIAFPAPKKSFKVKKKSVATIKRENDLNLKKLLKEYLWLESKKIKNLWIMRALVIELTHEEALALSKSKKLKGMHWSLEPLKIDLDSKVTTLNQRHTYGIKKIQAAKLQKEYPHLTGKGIRVGVLDSGIEADHKDLKDRITLYKNFSPIDQEKPSDEFDHGTHIAGTIAGGNKSGENIGVAPAADLLIARIFDKNVDSSLELILDAMQWMTNPDGNSEINDYARVVNASWGKRSPYLEKTPEDESLCGAVKVWNELGIIPVVSAGNTGSSEKTINISGACPGSISIGATEHNDRLMYFSSVGPAVWKDRTLKKPELCAPGFRIKSASAEGGYREMSGTSMATPHVAGAFVLLVQAFPERPAVEIQDAMISTTKDLGPEEHDKDFGWGRIDVYETFKKLETQ